MNNVIEISQTEMVAALNRAEVDVQVATAKRYPRDIEQSLQKILNVASMDTETAEECFYTLRRGYGDDSTLIEGVSVRLAEIIASCWGNIRVQTRIIGNDGRTITAQAVCHDLETNVAVSVEVKRRITDRNGRTYSDDMQVVTGNAASAIAYRNAVLKVVPKAVTKAVINQIKDFAMGQSLSVESSRQKMFGYFQRLGVTAQQICDYLGVENVGDIDQDAIFELRGLANAIKEGTTTVDETFGAVKAHKEQTEKQGRIEDAMRKAKAPRKAEPETANTKK